MPKLPPEAPALDRIDRRTRRLALERVALAAGFLALAGAAVAVSWRWTYAAP